VLRSSHQQLPLGALVLAWLPQVADNRRPEQPDERAGFDGLLSALLGWVLAMLPTFR
jgi:hypothetical protein